MAGDEVFPGFELQPLSGYSQLYHDWLSEIIANINNVAELKVVLYTFRHTCGFQEAEVAKYITVDEFMFGRKHKDGTRMDFGTRLSEMSVRTACKKGVEHGFLVEDVDDTDFARIKKGYNLNFRNGVQVLESGVQSLDPGTQSLESGTRRVRPRSVKETPEKNSSKETYREILVTHSQKELSEKALDFMEQKKLATFYELERYLHRYIKVRGHRSIYLSKYKNAVVWHGMSDEFCETYMRLQANEKIALQFGSESLYIKGRKLRLPLATALEDHEELQWHPMIIKYVE